MNANPMILVGLLLAPFTVVPQAVTPAANTNGTSGKVSTDLRQAGRYFQFQADTMNRVLGVTYSGVLPQLKNAPNPLHLFNPLAPASYGDGYANVSYNLRTGEPEGIRVWAVRF